MKQRAMMFLSSLFLLGCSSQPGQAEPTGEKRVGFVCDDGETVEVRFIWTTCRIASADFLPSWRGKPVPDAPPLDTSRVRQIGLMVADRQEGPFALAIARIVVEKSVKS